MRCDEMKGKISQCVREMGHGPVHWKPGLPQAYAEKTPEVEALRQANEKLARGIVSAWYKKEGIDEEVET